MSALLVSELQSKLYLTLVCVLCAVHCSALCRRDGAGPARSLSLGAIAFAGGLPTLLFKDFVPHAPALLVGNALVLVAMGLFWHATAQLCGRAPPSWSAAPAPLVWAACWFWPAFRTDLDLRIAVAALLAGTMAALATHALRHQREWRLPHRLLAAVGTVYVLTCALRCVFALAHQPVGSSPIWITCTEGNVLGYIVLWPSLCLALLHQDRIERETRLGTTDELSGLLNRRGFFREAGRGGAMTLLLFDIDHFKRINDSFGHAVGDAAIAGFGMVARDALGRDAVIGRIGGEEFAALVPDDGAGLAATAAARVRRAFAALPLPSGARATVSAGVAGPTAATGIGQQLQRADQALYRAKRHGRDRIELWTAPIDDGPADDRRAEDDRAAGGILLATG